MFVVYYFHHFMCFVKLPLSYTAWWNISHIKILFMHEFTDIHIKFGLSLMPRHNKIKLRISDANVCVD